MSYLDVPRIHFFGRFYTDPSTINNLDSNFATDNPSPLWNPNGTHYFRFQNCAVCGVRGLDGIFDTSDDPIIGTPVTSTEDKGVAKLVDLDPDQQGASAVFGHRITLGAEPGAGGTGITFDMKTAEANGLWNTVVQTVAFTVPPNNGSTSAYFQTIMSVPDASWPAAKWSPVFDQLRAASDVVEGNRLVSLRFVCDAFIDKPGANFKTGRIAGTFGPGKANEPRHCVAGRMLIPRVPPSQPATPAWNFYTFNRAPFIVDAARRKLVIDLGNSMPFLTPGGSTPNIGQLLAQIALKTSPPVTVGQVNYSAHNISAGVVEIDLTADQIAMLDSNPLQLRATSIGFPPAEILAEAADGVNFSTEQRVFRMAFDAPGYLEMTTPVYVTRYGKPAAELQLVTAMLATGSNGGLPSAADCLDSKISPSDANGIATLTLTAVKDPGKPAGRQGLDGQVYRIGLFEQPPGANPTVSQPPEHTVTSHLYASYQGPAMPEWVDVLGLLARYKTLYPGMFELLDLSDESAVSSYAQEIAKRMTALFDSAGFMPVTRDMSPNKVATILKFVSSPRQLSPRRIQAATQQDLPYTVSFEEMKYPDGQAALPALNGFSSVVSPDTGEWLVFGGLKSGVHSFTHASDFSPYIYAIDPATGKFSQFDVRTLPADLPASLLFSNAQIVNDFSTGLGYLVGGIGLDGTAKLTTFGTMTRFSIDRLILAIKNSLPAKETAALLEQASDPRFAVTGGVLIIVKGVFYLLFGQKVTQISDLGYTEAIRHFRIDKRKLGIFEPSYGAIPDPGDHSFHRRDLTVTKVFDPDSGAERIAAFAGVFRVGRLAAYSTPIYVEPDNDTTVEDKTFNQKMNLYQCPVIPVFDEKTRNMSCTFFGGYGGWELQGQSLTEFTELSGQAASNQASMVIKAPGGNYSEIVIPNAIPGGRHIGTDSQFQFVPGLQEAGQLYPNRVLKLSGFAPGRKTLIGHIYGGIETLMPSTQTTVSNSVFAVYLTNSPSPGILVSS